MAAVMQQYVCPMHPQIKSHAPGDCPICNMALVPMTAALSDAPGSAQTTNGWWRRHEPAWWHACYGWALGSARTARGGRSFIRMTW